MAPEFDVIDGVAWDPALLLVDEAAAIRRLVWSDFDGHDLTLAPRVMSSPVARPSTTVRHEPPTVGRSARTIPERS
jgi:hypothetical protein